MLMKGIRTVTISFQQSLKVLFIYWQLLKNNWLLEINCTFSWLVTHGAISVCLDWLIDRPTEPGGFHSIPIGVGGLRRQRLRPQHGSINHPQKISSKHWVLKIHGRISKKRNYLVADRIMSLWSSDYSSPKKKGYCQVQHRVYGIHGPP